MCGPATSTTSGTAISVTTAQMTAMRTPWRGSVSVAVGRCRGAHAHVTSISPLIQPIVCIGPPLPKMKPRAHGTKHCQR